MGGTHLSHSACSLAEAASAVATTPTASSSVLITGHGCTCARRTMLHLQRHLLPAIHPKSHTVLAGTLCGDAAKTAGPTSTGA